MPDQRHYEFPAARILVFSRAPVYGQVKTRLASSIGKQAALDVHLKLLEQTLDTTVSSRLAPVELWLPSALDHGQITDLAMQHTVPVRQQLGTDLGERMAYALETTLQKADFCVLIGSDCPVMDDDYLRQACQQLQQGSEVVIGPAEDGGYVLVGLRKPCQRLFTDIAWGTDQVLSLTRQRARSQQLGYHELPVLWDIDQQEDLLRWLG